MSSNSITNSLHSNGSRSNQPDSGLRCVHPTADSTSSSLEQKRSSNAQRANYSHNYNENSFNENYLSKNHNAALNGPAASVRTSFSFASTVSSDSGCNVNTNSMDASVISANNFNESLMSCSIMTNNSLFANEELVDDDEEQILTVSHNNGGEQIVNQMNVKHYIEQLNASQSSQNGQPLISASIGNQTALQYSGNNDGIPLSSTCEDFGEISSRAESQLSAIYQQIDELKSKIDEIDHDNGRIKAKMNSLVSCGNSKVSLGVKKNASFNVRLRENNEGYSYDHRSAFGNSFLPPASAANAVPNNAAYTNSSEESGSSPTYSPASTSPSLASSPTQNSNSAFVMNDSLLNNCQQSNKSLQHPVMTSSASFNSSNCTTTPSSCWSLASICSAQNVPASSGLTTNSGMSIIEEYKVTNGFEDALEKDHNGSSKTRNSDTNGTGHQTTTIDSKKSNNEEQLGRVYSYLKQNDPSRLHTQLKCQDQLQKLLSNGRRRKSFGTSKFANARRSLDEYSKFGRTTLNNSNAINRLSNESWVSTTTDDLLASSDEEQQTLNYVNNQLKTKKFESRLARQGMLSESRTVPASSNLEFKSSANSKSDHKQQSAESPKLARPMLLPNYDYNSEKDAFASNNNESTDRKPPPKSGHRSQIPKPLTPIKTNDKRLKPINGSRIPIMRPIIENEFDLLSSPPSPAPIDRHVNRVDYRSPQVHQIDSQTNRFDAGTPVSHRLESTPVQNRCLPKPKPFSFKKFDYTDSSCLVSPLTQQLKFEKEQRKLNYSFRKKSYAPADHLLTSPPLSSDSGCQSDNSPLPEQAKHQTLAYQIQSLRLELRDVSCAINDVKKDDYYGQIVAKL